MGEKIYVIAMAIALFGVAWNILALIFHVIFGVNLPMFTPDVYG